MGSGSIMLVDSDNLNRYLETLVLEYTLGRSQYPLTTVQKHLRLPREEELPILSILTISPFTEKVRILGASCYICQHLSG